MDDKTVGRALLAIRRRKRLRQDDVALAARISRWTVMRMEHGHLEEVALPLQRAVAMALGGRLELVLRWEGVELDRLLNAGHSAMHEIVARRFNALPGWIFAPEVSFSVYGERGVIDVLAWHATTASLLVIEIKTDVVEIQLLIGGVDRKRRLARSIAADRGWTVRSVSSWVVIADTGANRRRCAAHRHVLRGAFPTEGRTVAAWLRKPEATLNALSFLPVVHEPHPKGVRARNRRVRRPRLAPIRA